MLSSKDDLEDVDELKIPVLLALKSDTEELMMLTSNIETSFKIQFIDVALDSNEDRDQKLLLFGKT